MESVLDIEKAIDRLPRAEIFQLMEWIEKKANDSWDNQFERDAKSGKLDSIAQQALLEHKSGKSQNFPDNKK